MLATDKSDAALNSCYLRSFIAQNIAFRCCSTMAATGFRPRGCLFVWHRVESWPQRRSWSVLEG
jgi:hypothetical protein